MCLSLYVHICIYASLSYFVGKREQNGSKFILRHRLTPCLSPYMNRFACLPIYLQTYLFLRLPGYINGYKWHILYCWRDKLWFKQTFATFYAVSFLLERKAASLVTPLATFTEVLSASISPRWRNMAYYLIK